MRSQVATHEYYNWLKNLPGKPVFVGYPATFDFSFVYWYLIFYRGESPFGFQAIDIKTYAMSMLRTPFKRTTKKIFPKRWFNPDSKHTHIALDDAIDQGHLFINMLQENKNTQRISDA